ncbi:LacI family DNA-binding transcriptional regulator [Actinoplanes sp. URMC 104]|uniref:LacI family DNA-binding transcriptional regulator n=1 Tax=Actinoplanes sp. URMC 104 TaxID=3423409 RepID=UPI003F1BDFD1
MPERRITLDEIAHDAGVSVATVSRVLNGFGQVAPSTRQRVDELLRRHSYRPRASHKRSAAGVIHVIFPEIDCAWELEQLRGMESVAQDAGVGLVAMGGARVVEAPSDGVMLAATSGSRRLTEALERRGVPVVVVDPAARPLSSPAVGATNWAGARAAAAHLAGLGHRRIAMIAGSPLLLCTRARIDGFRSLLGDTAPVEHGEYSYATGLDAGRRLLDRADRPTAVFASSDQIALGVYEAARRLGLRIPGDLSVVGFDDVPLARWASPPLTTVRQPLRDMGRLAARTVLQLSRGDEAAPASTELATRLIVRGSTAALG